MPGRGLGTAASRGSKGVPGEVDKAMGEAREGRSASQSAPTHSATRQRSQQQSHHVGLDSEAHSVNTPASTATGTLAPRFEHTCCQHTALGMSYGTPTDLTVPRGHTPLALHTTFLSHDPRALRHLKPHLSSLYTAFCAWVWVPESAMRVWQRVA